MEPGRCRCDGRQALESASGRDESGCLRLWRLGESDGPFFACLHDSGLDTRFPHRGHRSRMHRPLSLIALLVLLGVPALGNNGAAHAQRLLTSTGGSVAGDTLVLDRIEASFRAGDAGALMASAGEPIDLAIFGHGASYSRSQAVLVLLDFFRRHPPEEVSFQEEVVGEDRRSVVGQYREVGSEEASAIFVRLRARAGRWEIRSIRIERSSRRF